VPLGSDPLARESRSPAWESGCLPGGCVQTGWGAWSRRRWRIPTAPDGLRTGSPWPAELRPPPVRSTHTCCRSLASSLTGLYPPRPRPYELIAG